MSQDPFGYNTGYIEDLYQQYLDDPNSVSESWQEFFSDYEPGPAFRAAAQARASRQPEAVEQPTAAPTTNEALKQPTAVRPKPPTGDGARQDAKPATPPPSDADLKPMRGVAARIVENMEQSLGIPTATSMRQVPVKLMAENRRLINDYQKQSGGAKVSFTHLIGYAIVKALAKYPNMNAAYHRDNGTPQHVTPHHVNLGLAIDVEKKDGSRSLLVPNIKGAEELDFAGFLGCYNDLVQRARTNSLEISDFQGTTVTLTNPGMIGTVMSVPRLMPGQGTIIAVGAIGYPPEMMALPPDAISKMGLSQVMSMTSTYDHRVIQGAESGAFLSYMAELLLGQHKFYREVFAALRIPYPPLSMAVDTTPQIGREDDELAYVRKQARVLQLIRAYRVRGHLMADLNPLGEEQQYHPDLDPATYDLSVWDVDREFITGGLGGKDKLPFKEILKILWDTYTRKVGVEYMHISDPAERRWLQERIEPQRMNEPIPAEWKKRILDKLNEAEALEKFIHTKYIGHKRFSLEGAETLIPILDRILSDAADQEVKEVVMGMAHRGRLNVLANTLGKPYDLIFSEFEGNIDPGTVQGSGDVKYHLGTKGTHKAPSQAETLVTLASNPSHLEAVDPVVEGMVRAKQDKYWNHDEDALVNFDKVLPLLIHGDAAFAGQGVVPETLNLSQLTGYRTGGTVHIVVNNQIGFTTLPSQARSTVYATDVARMVQAPIFHVNGDDPEAAIRVARLALDYRQVFNKDVVIDMICYRQHGHNEGDEPMYTQPLLYQKIKNHRSVRKIYTEQLVRRGDLSLEDAEAMLDGFRNSLQKAFEETKNLGTRDASDPHIQAVNDLKQDPQEDVDTSASEASLRAVLKALTTFPDWLDVHPKLLRQIQRREKQFDDGKADWALGEALAFGTLLQEGIPIRMSGQDSRRGTFSHRHAVIHDQDADAEYLPLNYIQGDQAQLHVFDSLLSEYAALGFEYGYSVERPETLVLWEAQFGDFANGAQIMIDQFIAAAEEKWGQRSSLVMLLPHGYEGQGPEHSSARMERFLQLCAEDNLIVANITTPANFFHALRRQVKRTTQKPLIVMSPKSLLRHPLAVSQPSAFMEGRFQKLILDTEVEKAERVVFCSGKIYYDLLQARQQQDGDPKVALLRVEQLYPFPDAEVRAVLEQYGTQDVLWVQEEPANAGGWRHVQPYFDDLMVEVLDDRCPRVRYVGRKAAASPATGSAKVHAREQKHIVDTALDV